MAESIRIKPADGKNVRDPHTMKPLAADGEDKPRNSYWLRRLAAGDVVEATTAAAKKTTKKATDA